MAAHTSHPLATQFSPKIHNRVGHTVATLAEALSSTALIGGLLFLTGSVLPALPPPSAPRSRVLTAAASTVWMQAVALSCGPQPSPWQPIIGRALQCEAGHVVSVPATNGVQGLIGVVSAVGVPRGMTVRLECYGSSLPTIAKTTLHADGHGHWLGTVGVWSCPATPMPLAILKATHP